MQLRHQTAIYRQGDLCPGAYCVVQGHVKLSRLNRDGEATMVVLLKAGDWFGALDGSAAPSAESAVAKGSVRLRLVPRAALQASADDAAAIIASMARRQRFLEQRLEALLFLDVRARLAAVLLDLARFCGQHCRHGHEIDLRLTHQELAELSGVSRPVVTATLNRWRRETLLRYTREYICIEQHAALTALLR
ncbi:MAG: Crp/Fnr family transcriptional regulator [Nevskia sp.]